MATNSEDRYVLARGDEAVHRLRVVNSVHGADTRRFLRRAGLSPGWRVADLGCGTGFVTEWIAREVGVSGEVVGVDISPEQVATADARLRSEGLTNARFVAASAAATGLERETFDLVFCRFVLMHVPDPQAVLREMRNLLKPGGVLACEDGDFTRPFCEPPSAAFDRCFELYRAVGERRGLDFRIGPKLYRMVQAAGFARPEVALVQPVFGWGEQKRLPDWTLSESSQSVLDAGLATQDEIDRIVGELRGLADDETVLFAMAQMTQVWATKDAS